MNKLIRVLYGDIKGDKKTLREINLSLQSDWVKKNIAHYVMGKDNAKILKSMGALDIRLVNDKPDLRPKDRLNIVSHFYNKTYLIEKAMKEYDEILFTDFDCSMIKQPDSRMWELLRSKEGRFNGSFQCPNVSYKRKVCISKSRGGKRDPKIHPMRKCLNTSVLYCNDKKWIDGFLLAFHEYSDYMLKFRPSAKIPPNGGGEAILMYYIDKQYGVIELKDMFDCFEPYIMTLGRGLGGMSKSWEKWTEIRKDKNNIYFTHY